jgi:hypothetical protein
MIIPITMGENRKAGKRTNPLITAINLEDCTNQRKNMS